MFPGTAPHRREFRKFLKGAFRKVSIQHSVKLSENVYFIKGEGNGRFPSSHGFLLTGSETVLVDAGIGKDRIEAIDREKRIDILLITHSHPDHIRYWKTLSDRHILQPKETPESVKDLQLLGERFTGSAEDGAHWVEWVNTMYGVEAMRDPDGTYTDGDLLEIGGARMRAIHAPGHIMDHYCFLEENTGTLITSDIDLTSFGPWYGNPESDIETFEAGVRKVMSLSYNRVCSSHRGPIEGDATRYFGMFLKRFADHRRKVLDLCDAPVTFEDLLAASPFYAHAFPNKIIQRIFETNLIAKNLDLLIRDGLVEKTDRHYRRI
jgi:hydroxyacylglutathione hydrolase